MGKREIFTCFSIMTGRVVNLQLTVILKYIFFILAGAGLIAGIVIIIILALIIIGLLVYWLFWRRRQNRDSDTEFHNKNSKKRPISPKELGMCIYWEIFSKICCRNLTHFIPLISFYTPWKHKKTRGFSDVFRGYRKRLVAWNGLSLL